MMTRQFLTVDHTGEESSVYVQYNAGRDVICTCESDMEGSAALRAKRIADCLQACEGLTDPSAVADLLAACLAWNQPAKTAEDIDRAYELTRAAIRKATRVPA